MTLIDMAKEYRKNATMLYVRIDALKAQLKTTKNALERMRLRRRIRHYESVYADNMSTVKYLESYYRGGA